MSTSRSRSREEEQLAVADPVHALEVVHEVHARAQGPDLARVAVGVLRFERAKRLDDPGHQFGGAPQFAPRSPRRAP
jgi:hypothetical protein